MTRNHHQNSEEVYVDLDYHGGIVLNIHVFTDEEEAEESRRDCLPPDLPEHIKDDPWEYEEQIKRPIDQHLSELRIGELHRDD